MLAGFWLGGILAWGDFVWFFFVRGGGGVCPGGFCPGGFCPVTIISINISCE